jgi:ElaB/YqjD/DUF883 family membrane-anchored ribosome-binding protein
MINPVTEEFEQAKHGMAAAAKPVLDAARHGAGVAGGYLRARPWSALGIAIAAGMLIGFLAANR